MKRLPEDALAILELAREADDPTPKQRERADAALRSTLTAYGIGTLPPLPPPAQPGVDGLAAASRSAASAVAPPSPLASKALIVAVVSVAAAGAVTFAALTPNPAPEQQQRALAPGVEESVAQAPTVVAPMRQAPQSPALPAPALHAEQHTAKDHAARPGTRPLRTRRTRSHAPNDASMLAQLRLISTANGALRAGRTERALSILDEYDERFEHGFLATESRALRALAHCSMDDTPAERAERARALHSARGSVLSARVRAACAADDGP